MQLDFDDFPNSSKPVAILIRGSAMTAFQLRGAYLSVATGLGMSSSDLRVYEAPLGTNGKVTIKAAREALERLLMHQMVDVGGARYIYVADGQYFKVLTKTTKVDPHYGYVMPCVLKGYEHINIVLGVNHQALIYNPALQDKLEMGFKAIAAHASGTYQEPGSGIIHSEAYPTTLEDIKEALEALKSLPELFVDIEAFSLSFFDSGIGTISFSTDKHNGIAFTCDYSPLPFPTDDGLHGEYIPNIEVRKILKDFFTEYEGIMWWHYAQYDLKSIIYTLWMESPTDYVGLLEGLHVMADRSQDTKNIAYLALNSTSSYSLSLKDLAQEFAGNWAMFDIKDIRKIPLDDLLRYNLVDTLSTAYVKETYFPVMVSDNQMGVYEDIFIPSMKLLIQTELVGMPMSDARISAVKNELTTLQKGYEKYFRNSLYVKEVECLNKLRLWETANKALKTKRHPLDKFEEEATFNPNSNRDMQALLYDTLALPVLDLTATKQPAVGGKTLSKLINHCQEEEEKEVVESIKDFLGVDKVIGTFLPAFERGKIKDDFTRWLHGSFNLGGTVSGRLSSSGPNMQNIPSNSIYGSIIKSAFVPPKGWIFAGADFSSLEDMISALLTKDPNKLKVYLEGYDGHCLRAFSYFRSQMPDIVDSVESINSVEDLYPDLRQNSKAPTFLLTYGGSWRGLMRTLGIPEEEAKRIEANFIELYAHSIAFIKSKIDQAAIDGYVTLAFGLRLRTPLLASTYLDRDKAPFEAQEEARTAGNALGQGYGMLNSRAAAAFMRKVWESEYRYDIMPVALIHDAIYLIFKDCPKVAAWVNTHLIQEMQWQELPEIWHEEVKLGANLEIYWPSWNNPLEIPNNATPEEIQELCIQHEKEYLNG